MTSPGRNSGTTGSAGVCCAAARYRGQSFCSAAGVGRPMVPGEPGPRDLERLAGWSRSVTIPGGAVRQFELAVGARCT